MSPNRPWLSWGLPAVVAAMALAGGLGAGQDVPPAAAQKEERDEKRESQEKKAPPAKRGYKVTVQVVEAESGASVASASVTLFYGAESQTLRTESRGRASFRFSTEAKDASVRVVADRFNSAQSLVTLDSGEAQLRVQLTKSN